MQSDYGQMEYVHICWYISCIGSFYLVCLSSKYILMTKSERSPAIYFENVLWKTSVEKLKGSLWIVEFS
jgi:hypothetical protein